MESMDDSPRSPVFIDYLRFTVPRSERELVMLGLTPYMEEIGGSKVHYGYQCLSGGTLTVKDHYQVTSFAFTARLLAEMREAGSWLRFLAWLSLLPAYRLTLAHFTLDVSYPGWLYIPWFYEACRSGRISITRKRHITSSIRRYFAPSYVEPAHDTGTVYLGTRKAERRLTVYDKQQERFDRAGERVAATTRFELSLSDEIGFTCKDLASPSAIFYHFMSEILTPPSNVPKWVRREAIGGYSVDKVSKQTPYARAIALLERVEPTMKAIRKLSYEDPTRSEAFQDLVMSRIRTMLVQGG